MVPVLIGVIIDRAVSTGDVTALVVWGGTLVALFGVLSYAYRFGSRIGVRIAQEEMHALRVEITQRALDPRGVRTKLLPGETISLATADAEQIGDAVHGVGFAFSSLVAVLVSAVVLVRTDLLLAVLVLAGVPTVLVIIQAVTPLVARRSRDRLEDLAHATGVAADLVRGFRTIKGIGAEDVGSTRYRRASARAQEAGIRAADSVGIMTGLTAALSGLFLALVAGVAGSLALERTISVGELIAIVGLTQFLTEPMRWMGSISAEVAAAYGAGGRIVAYLQAPPLLSAGGEQVVVHEPVLVLDDVHAASLTGISASSRPGELLGLAIVSPSDAEALVGLLAGARRPSDVGGVTLGGTALTEWETVRRRTALLVAPHQVDLFEGTLATNVDPRGRLSTEDLDTVVTASQTTDVVALHPAGLDQPISPGGGNLSGGQRQRIAFARALATGTPVVVLHEPTTAVDAVTEHRMAAGLREIRHSPGSRLTTWVITSSPALLGQADRVLLVSGGRVVAEGTHQELSARADYRQAALR